MTKNEEPAWTKIGFQQTVDDLVRYGPSAQVGVAGAAAQKSVVRVAAQIDTGAAGTGISPRLASRLGLSPIDVGTIHEAGREPISANFYAVRLFLPWMEIEIEVAGLPSLPEPHDILIGRDVLAGVRLSVDFTTGITLLHFKNQS